MYDYSTVLCVGKDSLLLNLRCQVLATRFAAVSTATPITLRQVLDTRTFDLLVLCHTLSARDCNACLHLFRERCPAAATLAMQTDLTGCGAGDVDATAAALAGPRSLFRAIESVMRNGTPRFGLLQGGVLPTPDLRNVRPGAEAYAYRIQR